jgi:hypothetical protein
MCDLASRDDDIAGLLVSSWGRDELAGEPGLTDGEVTRAHQAVRDAAFRASTVRGNPHVATYRHISEVLHAATVAGNSSARQLSIYARGRADSRTRIAGRARPRG